MLICAGAHEAAAQQKPGADAKSAGAPGKAASGEAELGKDLEAAKTTFMAAQRLFSQQKFDEALPLFREAFEISKSPNATIMIGNCLVMMGRSAEAYEALSVAEGVLGRTINPTILTKEEWREKALGADSFVKRVAGRPKLFLIGEEDALR